MGRCLCSKICVWRTCVACAAHTQLIFACVALMCAVTAVGARVRTAVVRCDFVWFGLHISSPAGSHPARRSPSGTLTKDTRQCGHPSAVCLEQSTGTLCSSCCCMRDGLHMDLQWSCDVASNSDLTALVYLWLPFEGPGSALPSGHPACLFLHRMLTGSTALFGQQKEEGKRKRKGWRGGRSWGRMG